MNKLPNIPSWYARVIASHKPINQCDGCCRMLPTNEQGIHYIGDHPIMACEKERYLK